MTHRKEGDAFKIQVLSKDEASKRLRDLEKPPGKKEPRKKRTSRRPKS